MDRSRIAVIGSTNMDMVVKSENIPVPGETVLGGDFLMNPGGKGANQAVAIARLGGKVTFITKVGNDMFGRQFAHTFEEESIDISGILYDSSVPSGVALITVDESGENSIVVASGANQKLSENDVRMCMEKISNVGILLLQLEIPMDTVKFAVQYASSKGIKIILNPAPANRLVPDLYKMVDIITPNTNEAEMLSGIKIIDMESAKKAAEFLIKQGVKNVVITLGVKGAVVLQSEEFHIIPPTKVNAIDSTAAGDVFNGALAIAISEGKSLVEAAKFACLAGSITATRMGAQSSIPYRNEVVIA